MQGGFLSFDWITARRLVGARRGLVTALAGLVVAGPLIASVLASPGARGGDAFDDGNPRVEAELLVDASELRPGQTVRVGVLFEMDPGWHIYWRNSGESGLPTELEWQFPGTEVGPILWPAPTVFREADGFLTTYGYGGEVLLQAEARSVSLELGMARVEVIADFVTCEIGCIPGQIVLARDVPVTEAGRPASPDVTARFDRYAALASVAPSALGLSVDARYSQDGVRPGDEFRAAIRVRSDAGADVRLTAKRADEAFVPEEIPGIALTVEGHEPAADGFSLVLAGRAWPDDTDASEVRVRGLIPVATAREARHIQVDVPLRLAARNAAVTPIADPVFAVTTGFDAAPVFSWSALLSAFGLALVGGLILNLMPCVLPILAIKVFHVAELAHERRRTVLAHGGAYTAGVLLSMVALAAVVLGLRAAGTAVGWGFQFQEPVFVAAIGTVLVVFALNLFGVFEVTLQPAGLAAGEGAGLRRSFFEGLLAVVLATPCTAPFLGTAVGFAFASSGPVIVAIFLAIGLGLAAPYALVTLVPAWAKIIPRPGPWMITVRKGLGFALIATVVWLLWIVGRTVGNDGQTLLMGYLVLVSFALWIFGSLQRSEHAALRVGAGTATALLVLAGLGALPLDPAPPAASVETDVVRAERAEESSAPAWQPYDLTAIRAQLALGRPVFVDFTADWCITCKVNESVVLADARVHEEFARLDVATFKADWTLYDDEIRSVLASFGKAGVPMYLVYRPGAPDDPELLPELLTVDLVLDAIQSAVQTAGAGQAPALSMSPMKGRKT